MTPQEARDYDARFARDEEGSAWGAKPHSEIASWEGWPDDVRGLLRHWNHQRRLSFRGGSFHFARLPGQDRLRGQVRDRTQVVFECARCHAPCETHPCGRATLDGRPFCDDCLVALAREWQQGKTTPGKAFDALTRLLKKSDDELAGALGLNPKTVRRWLRGQEPEAKDARRVLQLHVLALVLARKLGEREARLWLKARWEYVLKGELSELTTLAEPLIFPIERKRRRASSLADIAPGAIWQGDYGKELR